MNLRIRLYSVWEKGCWESENPVIVNPGCTGGSKRELGKKTNLFMCLHVIKCPDFKYILTYFLTYIPMYNHYSQSRYRML